MTKILRMMTNVGFVKKNIESDKVRDHCHLTSKNRSPAHNVCNIIFANNKVILFHSFFTILVSMIAICFSRV